MDDYMFWVWVIVMMMLLTMIFLSDWRGVLYDFIWFVITIVFIQRLC